MRAPTTTRPALSLLTHCALAAGLVTAWVAPAAAATSDERLARMCDLGITLAMQGRLAAAESVFVSLLSRSPRDPRALNNLGNVGLWRREYAVAAGYYQAALRADSADAGISLNAANAAMLAGRADDAQSRAESAVRQAGGLDAAAGLLGMRLDRTEAEAATTGDRTRMNREQVLQLMRNAARAIPDSLARGVVRDSAAIARRKRAPLWRPAAARSSESTDDPPCAYWKR